MTPPMYPNNLAALENTESGAISPTFRRAFACRAMTQPPGRRPEAGPRGLPPRFVTRSALPNRAFSCVAVRSRAVPDDFEDVAAPEEVM